MSKKLLLSLLLCLTLFGAANPALAQELQKNSDDTLTKMLAEGWKIVNEGVLQRELGPGKVESYVFGVPGFTWKIQNLRRQLQELRAEFRAHPTPELRKVIANHRKVIANAERALEIARTYEALGESGVPKEDCTINSFSANATAGAKTDVQGVWADAGAAFSGDCDAQVNAYVVAKTGVNGGPGPTVIMADGPRSATGGPANVHVESNGGAPCESYAFSEVTITGKIEPLARSQYQNYVCPPPLAVTVTADTPSTIVHLYNSDCITIAWNANISGGTSPYNSTMYLNGASQGTRTTYSKTYCNAGTNSSVTAAVSSTVTDSGIPVQSRSALAPTITIQSHKVVPPSVTINDPTIDDAACITYTWTASISGGTSPFTYRWTWKGLFGNTAVVGTGSSYSRQFCRSSDGGRYYLGLTVTDSASLSGSDSREVFIPR